MANKNFLIDLSKIDFENPIAEIDDIRDFNPQRHEMEHLSAMVYENSETLECVGYLDVTDHEFWIRGHMPDFPLMPGVIQLEAVAQMCSYFVQKNNLLQSELVGFGGVEKVRFREPVLPGQRLILMARVLKARPRRMMTCEFQGVVGDKVAIDGILKGVPLPVQQLKKTESSESNSLADSQTDLATN